MGRIREFFSKIKGAWDGLSRLRKTSIIIILVSLLIALIVYPLTIGKTEYLPVFTNLSIQDSAQIVDTLEDQNFTDYKIADGGSTILAPADQVDTLRINLAMECRACECLADRDRSAAHRAAMPPAHEGRRSTAPPSAACHARARRPACSAARPTPSRRAAAAPCFASRRRRKAVP